MRLYCTRKYFRKIGCLGVGWSSTQNVLVAAAEKKKPSYGAAIVDGRLRYVSASAIAAFDPTQDGGCPSRWYFEKIEKRPTPSTKAQVVGTQVHEQIEHYLKTGERTIGPVVEPGAHFLPRPGSDLLVEETFGDYKQALALRDFALAGNAVDMSQFPNVLGIPVMGAMDLRHRRGEWVDTSGKVHLELPNTAEIVDWKTTSDVVKWGKRAEDLHMTVQMPLYAKATITVWPDIERVRLSHGQFGTARREARKVSALLDYEAIAWRFSHIESVVRSMIHVAKEPSADVVEKNVRSCSSYGGCPHRAYCNRPQETVSELFQIKKKETQMSNGLWDSMTNGTNGVPAPAATALTDEQRQAIIDAEKARLRGPDAFTVASQKIASGDLRISPEANQAFDKTSPTSWICRQATPEEIAAWKQITTAAPIPAAPVAPPPVSAVNPFDQPPPNLVAQAAPLPPHVIAEITAPELKQRAEAHAQAHAAQAAVAEVKAEKAAGRCPNGKQRIVLTVDDAMSKKIKCTSCGKELKLRPVKEEGQWVATLPGHNFGKEEETATPAAPVTAAAIPPAPVMAVPAAPIPPAPVVAVPAAPIPAAPVAVASLPASPVAATAPATTTMTEAEALSSIAVTLKHILAVMQAR